MPGCTGCTRRELLRGVGAGLVVIGCKKGDDPITVDAAPPPDAEPPVPCDTGFVCVDLTRPSAAALNTVGGSHKIAANNDVIVIVRTSSTDFETLSAICTHEGCGVLYTGTLLRCPCHGSQFRLDGTVIRGPAGRALRVYEHSFDATTQILKITL